VNSTDSVLIHGALWNEHPKSWLPVGGEVGAFEHGKEIFVLHVHQFTQGIKQPAIVQAQLKNLAAIVLDT
jgi:hypothetical protein